MKLFTYTFIGYFVFSFISFAQNTTLDSLKTIVKTSASDSIRVRALKEISWEYLNNRNDGDIARAYIDSVYYLSEKANLKWGVSIANYQYCVYERQKGNYDKALEYIDKYLVYTKSLNNDIDIANGLYQKAIILDDKGDQEEALKMCYEILKIYETKEDQFSIATTLNFMGEILKEIGKIEIALNAYNRSLEIYTELDNKIELANVNYNLGDTHLQLKDYDKALVFFNKALAYDQELNSDWGMAYDYTSLGKVSNFRGNHEQALAYHLKALELRKKLNQKRELALSYNEIGKTYLKLKDYDKAISYLENSIVISKEIGLKTEVKDAYEILVDLYAETGDFENALEYSNKFIGIKDSLFNETRSQQIEELQAKFDLEKKQDEISSLEKDAQIKDLKLKRQATLRNIIIGITLSIILFSIILFKRYQYRQKLKRDQLEKKQLKAIAESEKERVLELQKVDKLKDEFLANTSHELRTPLMGIIGLTESLKDGVAGKLPDEALDNLNMISNSGKRLSHLVNDILDFSQLKNKDIVLNLSPVDLFALTNIVITLCRPLLKSKDVQLINSISTDISLVSSDENRLQQILYNLIGNAIKFTEKGTIEVSAKEINDQIEITVADSGIGIPKEKYDRIFKPFEQADGSIIRGIEGTGLGLTVAKQLVELHGGSISFTSKVGKGTAFTFSLKKTTSKSIQLKPVTHLSETQLHKIQPTDYDDSSMILPKTINEDALRVLIVDDEQINRKVLQNHLILAGYKVEHAKNGREALSYFEQGSSFDLVLLDIMMPEISGYEVCETIREKHSANELPIILLTAKNRVNDLVAGFNAGANDYLTKPFSKDELLSRIKTHINLKNIHNATSKFIPTEFLSSINKNMITEVCLGDHIEKEITVLFTDIRDYTKLAESMTPEQNFKFVNAYVSRMGPIIKQNKGFVNQYLGDGIMALFPHDPHHAIQASIDMQKKLRDYNKQRVSDGYEPLSVGMGMHTGPLVMGIIGDIKRNDTAIIADTVNTASRMEGLTKFYGANIIVSGNSLKNEDNETLHNLRYLGKVQVKGKYNALDIYECFEGDTQTQVELKKTTLKDFDKGLDNFHKKSFHKAKEIFENILQVNPDDQVSIYFAEKSKQYLNAIPEDWEGVVLMDEK